MHLLEHLHRNVKTVAMPTAMVVGALRCRPISALEELSGLFFISKYHLSREYKKKYGITIGSDLTGRRISHAKSLLRFSDSSIEEIALLCGFADAGYFIKVFKKAENMTPLEYRRKW